MDSVSWLALGSALTLAGFLVSVLVWSRRGAGPGLQSVAWSLLPLAAALTGVLRLAGDIVDSVGRWAVRLVFSPSVWLGVVVAGVAVVLWGAGKAVSARSRRTPRTSRSSRSSRKAAVTGGPAPSLPGRAKGSSSVVDDQDDIEAILRKHGIE